MTNYSSKFLLNENKIEEIYFNYNHDNYIAKLLSSGNYSLYRYFENEGWYYADSYTDYGTNWKICENENTPNDENAAPIIDLLYLIRNFNLALTVLLR